MFCFNRCLADSGFAHIRKLFRRSDVDSLPKLEMLINKSTSTNEAVPFQTGTWQWRDWKAFLSRYFTALRGIRQFHHFRFTAETPWFVYVFTRRKRGFVWRKWDLLCLMQPIFRNRLFLEVFLGRGSCIYTRLCVRMCDQLIKKLCVLLQQRSKCEYMYHCKTNEMYMNPFNVWHILIYCLKILIFSMLVFL